MTSSTTWELDAADKDTMGEGGMTLHTWPAGPVSTLSVVDAATSAPTAISVPSAANIPPEMRTRPTWVQQLLKTPHALRRRQLLAHTAPSTLTPPVRRRRMGTQPFQLSPVPQQPFQLSPVPQQPFQLSPVPQQPFQLPPVPVTHPRLQLQLTPSPSVSSMQPIQLPFRGSPSPTLHPLSGPSGDLDKEKLINLCEQCGRGPCHLRQCPHLGDVEDVGRCTVQFGNAVGNQLPFPGSVVDIVSNMGMISVLEEILQT